MAGGAAAVGFMAHKLMTDYEAQGQSNQPSRSQDRGGSSTSWGSEETKSGQRKANRTKVLDDDLPNEVRCIVCMVNPREIILVPCNHVCLCEDCAEKIKSTCPVCNQRIQSKKVAYLS